MALDWGVLASNGQVAPMWPEKHLGRHGLRPKK
jgi:hypothetical protein